MLFRQSVPVEFHDGLSSHNNGGGNNIYDVITSQPTSQQQQLQQQHNNFASFPVTLPSSIIHSPNYFLSSKVFAKSVSTQTQSLASNYSGPISAAGGGRHCLSIIYQTEDEAAAVDDGLNEVAINVNGLFYSFAALLLIH